MSLIPLSHPQAIYSPFYSKWADKNCDKCKGTGVLPSEIPYWSPCNCMYKDEKYQPLYPQKNLVFTNEDGSVCGYYFWTKHTDPLTMSQPYREHFSIEAKIVLGQNGWGNEWNSNQKIDAENLNDLFDKCKRLSAKQYRLSIRSLYSDSGQSLDPKTQTLSINFNQ